MPAPSEELAQLKATRPGLYVGKRSGAEVVQWMDFADRCEAFAAAAAAAAAAVERERELREENQRRRDDINGRRRWGNPCPSCGAVLWVVMGGVGKGAPYATDRVRCEGCSLRFVIESNGRGFATGSLRPEAAALTAPEYEGSDDCAES